MKIALNNRNVILKYPRQEFNCNRCCFLYNWSLCHNLEFRDNMICRTVKTWDNGRLNEVFKL